jgi:hypothetical protein
MRSFLLGTTLVWVVLEVTAAVWHLLLFRDFYVEQMAAIERPFAKYIIPHLMLTNLFRAMVVVWFWMWLVRSGIRPSQGWKFGALLGLVCGLMVAEYYGTWRLKSLAWPVVEGLWAALQGIAVGATLAWIRVPLRAERN